MAGNGVAGFSNGSGNSAAFNYPAGMALHPDGSILIADQRNHRIRRLTANAVTTLAGNGQSGHADGAGATEARFNPPWGITVGTDGHLYVSDGENQRIRRIAPDGTVVTVAGSGGYSPQSALAASFRYPAGLVMDSSGAIVFVDMWNHAVRRLY
jgi:sugar lactone lactonase YvrE